MGRPPSNGAPSFRFNPVEVSQMEAILQKHEGHVPPRELLVALANKFSNSPERAGKVIVQMKQVWNWFQNRRYALRSKLVKSPSKPSTSPVSRDEVTPVRNVTPVPQQMPVTSGPNVVRNTSETPPMEFEAKSARDGAWYDVQAFLSHRYLETGNPEVLVRFAGFGPEEDEWVNIRKHVRQRSLPCEASECIVVLPGDLILCFQEGKEQALYFDAHVLDAQRRRHDVRGCRCRFLVRYDHDQSEEIVPLRKVCRRPETDYRLQQLHAANESVSASASAEPQKHVVDLASSSTSRVTNPMPGVAAIGVPPPPIMSAGPSVPPPAAIQTPPPTVPTAAGSSNPIQLSQQQQGAAIQTPPPTSVAAPTPTPTPTPIPTAATLSVSPASVAISAPVTVPVAPAPVSAANSAPVAPASAPVPVSGANSAPVTVPVAPASAPVPVSGAISAAVTVPVAPASAPVPISGAISAPVTVPVDPASAPVPLFGAISAPVTVPVAPASAPIPVSGAISASVTVPVAPSPEPVTAPAVVAEPEKVENDNPALVGEPEKVESDNPAPVPEQEKLESDYPVPVPEPSRVESANSGLLAGEAAIEANVLTPTAVSIVPDTKKVESSDPEKGAAGSSDSQGQRSGNPAVSVPEPENIESSAPVDPALEGNETVGAAGSTVTVSAATGSSDPIVSTKDVNE